ncbi:adenosine deaminase protein [Dioscorea alata]|uniref:Adenosine deaminase protein n=1 Tax=Dioscorea alata TaxID=55571 RepID=A0ACB7UP16_DIOAL|nr:adenosine deaminase protein [Dioscorea alata]
MEMEELCRELPKIELHAHLNGSVRDSTLLELAKVLGDQGAIDFSEVEGLIKRRGRSLKECFRLFDIYHKITTDHATVTRITQEVVEDFAAENVVYLELRTTPKQNKAKEMTKHSYMKAVIDGLTAVDSVEVAFLPSTVNARNLTNFLPNEVTYNQTHRKKIFVRLLLSIDRRETTAAAMETVNLALEMKNMGVIGIDLSGNPEVGEWQTFLPALQYAKLKGLQVTLHCGEVRNNREIHSMLDFYPQRIGHACYLEEEHWEKLKVSKIPVEICLTSNLRTERITSFKEHHFADLYNAKHPVSLCTDDVGLFSTTLSNEYYLAATTFGFNKEQVYHLSRNAIEFVFADDEVKRTLAEIYDAAERRFIL